MNGIVPSIMEEPHNIGEEADKDLIRPPTYKYPITWSVVHTFKLLYHLSNKNREKEWPGGNR